MPCIAPADATFGLRLILDALLMWELSVAEQMYKGVLAVITTPVRGAAPSSPREAPHETESGTGWR